jgi:alpha-L-rhamnosidase
VQDLLALAHAAAALGLPPATAANYSALAAATGAAFQKAWGGADGASYPTQCAAGMALALGITPPASRAAAAAALLHDVRTRGNVTTSGEIGNRYALLALGDAGAEGVEAVWSSLQRTNAPGYGWMLTMGETALAESWTDAPGDSHIHAMYGHIDEFLYKFVAGLRAVGEGGDAWRAVEIAPTLPAGCDWVRATFDSPRGLIAVAAERRGDGGRLAVNVTVPPGVDALYTNPRTGFARRVGAGTWAFFE